MLKIRDFAKIAEVATSTLRYYDEIGLLHPIYVDPSTGYRFYTIDQLPRLHRILAFKDLGLELSQIVQILDEEVSADALQGMLRIKQAELQQNIQAQQEQLGRIEARLKYLEQGDNMPTYEIILKAVKPQIVAVSRVFAGDFVHKSQRANALLAFLKQKGIKPIDHMFYLYDDKQYCNSGLDGIEIEVNIPIEPSDAHRIEEYSNGQIMVRELSAVPKMASILHRGSPYSMLEAYRAFGAWFETNAYTTTGPLRKVCLQREGDFNDHLTEIQVPVEKQL